MYAYTMVQQKVICNDIYDLDVYLRIVIKIVLVWILNLFLNRYNYYTYVYGIFYYSHCVCDVIFYFNVV